MSIFTSKFFTDTVNVYRQKKKTLQDMAYAETPVLSAVPCSLQSTENVDKNRGAMGLKKEDNILTLDVLFCAAGTAIKGQDIIKVTTSGHPELNEYFEIMGDADHRPDRFNLGMGYANFYLNKISTPNFIPSGS